MKDRIIELRNALGKNQTTFAKDLGLNRSFICIVEKGDRNLSDRTIKDICRIYNVSYNWLKYGEGDMFIPIDKEDYIADLVTKLEGENKPNTEKLLKIVANLSEEQVQQIFDLAKLLNEENQQ